MGFFFNYYYFFNPYFNWVIAVIVCYKCSHAIGGVVFATDVYLKREFIESSVSAQQANESVSRYVCV